MTNYRLILDISRTHLLSRIKQTSVAALGVTFGIGTFIILVSFMTGLNGLLDGLILNRTPHIHVYNDIKPSATQPIERSKFHLEDLHIIKSIKPKLSKTGIHNGTALLNLFANDKRVKGITPQVKANVFYLSGSIELNGIVTGIEAEQEAELFNFADYIVEGSIENFERNNQGILLGAGIAKKLDLALGNRVQLTTPKGDIFPLKIEGIYQSGLAEVDNIQSYVNIQTAQQILGEGGSFISDINIKLNDINLASEIAKSISSNYNLTAIDIKTANAQFETGTNIRNLITYAVSITLLIVAGFGIYNILNMLIYEKINDIAILKATGFSGSDVQGIFVSQAVIIGIIGAVLGLILGYGASVLISTLPFVTEALPTVKTYPVNFNPLYYIIGFTFAIFSTFLAGYLPARKARFVDPVEIIRGQ